MLLAKTLTSSTFKQALIAIGRIQTIFMSLRQKGAKDGDEAAGSSVRKYATAFQAHDARRRKAIAGAAEDGDDDGDDLGLDDDDRDSDSA